LTLSRATLSESGLWLAKRVGRMRPQQPRPRLDPPRQGFRREPVGWTASRRNQASTRPSSDRGGEERPPHQNTVGHRWRSTLAAAGLTGYRLHDLRHFYASGLIAAGCDVVTVQRALGHAKATTTLETYSHLWPSAEDRTRAAAAMLTEEVLRSGAGNLRARSPD